jgi:hypothetical protein
MCGQEPSVGAREPAQVFLPVVRGGVLVATVVTGLALEHLLAGARPATAVSV